MPKRPKFRAITYIDGFNLYHGIRENGWRDCLWLDVVSLSHQLIARSNRLTEAKYFTARIRGAEPGDNDGRAKQREAKRKRQSDYLEALATMDRLQIYEGHYLPKTVTCRGCGSSWSRPEEKKTDVQIATQMLVDAFEDRFDTAVIVSGDGDLVPPMVEIKKRHPGKRLICAFPPNRPSKDLAAEAYACFSISYDQLKSSQLPNPTVKDSGFEIFRPDKWVAVTP